MFLRIAKLIIECFLCIRNHSKLYLCINSLNSLKILRSTYNCYFLKRETKAEISNLSKVT